MWGYQRKRVEKEKKIRNSKKKELWKINLKKNVSKKKNTKVERVVKKSNTKDEREWEKSKKRVDKKNKRLEERLGWSLILESTLKTVSVP